MECRGLANHLGISTSPYHEWNLRILSSYEAIICNNWGLKWDYHHDPVSVNGGMTLQHLES